MAGDAPNRDIGRELVEGVRAIKAGEGRRFTVEAPGDVRALRDRMGLSQSALAELMGVSLHTLQDWEQGCRQPTGPGRALPPLVAAKLALYQAMRAQAVTNVAPGRVTGHHRGCCPPAGGPRPRLAHGEA